MAALIIKKFNPTHAVGGLEWFKMLLTKTSVFLSFLMLWDGQKYCPVGIWLATNLRLCFGAFVPPCTVSTVKPWTWSNTINTWLHSEAERRRPRPAWNLLPWGVRVCTYLSKRLLRREWLTLRMCLAKSQGLSPAFRFCCRRLTLHWKASSSFNAPEETFSTLTVAPRPWFSCLS